MKKVRDIAAVARGGKFTFVEQDGYVMSHPYFEALKQQVKDYRKTNNYPIGLNFDEEFEEEVCRNADPITCEDHVPPSLLEKMSSLTQALYRAAKGGFKTVSAEQLEERMGICGQCNFFSGKNGLLKVMCGRCGCGGLKAHLLSEHCPISKW